MKKLIILLVFVLIGCNSEPKIPKPPNPYTIWVGNAVFAIGYDINHWPEQHGSLTTFTDVNGKKHTIATCQIFGIDDNSI